MTGWAQALPVCARPFPGEVTALSRTAATVMVLWGAIEGDDMSEHLIECEVERVSDGDTIRVLVNGTLFKVRVLALDTEESNPGGTKPITRWGKEASRFATELMPVGSPLKLRLTDDGPLLGPDGEVGSQHIDNFGRLLAFVMLPEPVEHEGLQINDYQELMIRKGFSPYFVKYGRAVHADLDARYADAERAAQTAHVGVWNQLEANGVTSEDAAPRNYPQLTVWWELRARIIDDYRAHVAATPGTVLNTRLDYDAIVQAADRNETATIFMELKDHFAIGDSHHGFTSGSRELPFQVFMRDVDEEAGRAALQLALYRYVAEGEAKPRRNYAYITGALKLFRGRPEIVVTGTDQISDTPPETACT
ncbi:MAG: thermonuclease family protein [Pseudomonadota bacterium]